MTNPEETKDRTYKSSIHLRNTCSLSTKYTSTTTPTPEVPDLAVVGVKDYEQAAQAARELTDQGVTAIELCARFGKICVSKVAEAVGDKAVVGASPIRSASRAWVQD